MNFFVHARAAKYVVKILRVCKSAVQIKFRFSSLRLYESASFYFPFIVYGRTFYALADTQEIGVESFESLISLNSWILITQYSLRLYLSGVRSLDSLLVISNAKYLQPASLSFIVRVTLTLNRLSDSELLIMNGLSRAGDPQFSPGSGTQTASRFSWTSCLGSSYFFFCQL